jgi:ribulose-phosphate 3-epimerase
MRYEVIPAILVENLEEFQERIEVAEDFAETVQWDIMDGQFVEHVTFSDMAAISEVDTVLNIEAHLMVEHPEEWFDDLVKAGIDRVIIHAETVDDLPAIVERMKNYDFERGVAINPETSVDDIAAVAADLDVLLVMTVVPGSSGQHFLPEQMAKVKQLRKKYPHANISVDGGVNLATIKLAKEAGANLFAINSAIFETPDPGHAFEMLKLAAENGE